MFIFGVSQLRAGVRYSLVRYALAEADNDMQHVKAKEHMGLLKTLLQCKHLEASHLQNKDAERGRNKNIYAANADSGLCLQGE